MNAYSHCGQAVKPCCAQEMGGEKLSNWHIGDTCMLESPQSALLGLRLGWKMKVLPACVLVQRITSTKTPKEQHPCKD